MPRVIVAIIACLIFQLSTVDRAEARYLKCLEAARGKTLVWRSSWGSDGRDGGQHYKVTSVKTVARIPNRSVTLSLKAEGPASRSTRTITRDAEDNARPVCDSLTIPRRLSNVFDPVIENQELVSSGTSTASLETLEFIRYSRADGWVRADAGSAKGKLEKCRILEKRFSCPADDKKLYGSQLRVIEEELKSGGF